MVLNSGIQTSNVTQAIRKIPLEYRCDPLSKKAVNARKTKENEVA
jgi:hypothetical protein